MNTPTPRRTHRAAIALTLALAALAHAQNAPLEPDAIAPSPKAAAGENAFSDLPVPELARVPRTIERAQDTTPDTRDHATVIHESAVDAISRFALRQIRTDIQNPSHEDYRRIALVLEILQREHPDDAERMRFLLDAWTWADDKQRANATLRKLLKLDPKDSVLQLRFINDAIQKKQNADERLAMYERLIGPAGDALDPAVKSHLAVDAALLYREMGDEPRYLAAIGLATELDPTNKEAAALYATYFLDRTQDPIERLEVLVNVVLADPHDEQAHLNVAHELMINGAWLGAQRFLQRVNELHAIRGTTLNDNDLFDIALTLWNASGPDEALSLIDGLLNREIIAEEYRRQGLISQGKNPGPQLPIVLPVDLETIRLAIYTARGDTEQANLAMKRISVRHQIELNLIRRPELRPPWMTEIDALKIEQHRLIERIACRLWSGQELDLARLDLDTLKDISARRPVHEDAIARFEGLFAVWEGRYDEARERLEPLAAQDPLARLGLGMLAQFQGDEKAAIANYARTALMAPNTAIGSAARYSIELIRGEKLVPTETAKRLNDYALGLDPWIESVTQDPYNFMRITLDHEKRTLLPLERMNLTLSITNVSRRPLPIGAGLPIQSRVLLAPAIDINGITLTDNLVPEVIRLDRRLRLMPNETISVNVWAGRGWIGALNDYAIENALTMRWRALQGFNPTEAGGFNLGALCVTTATDLLRRGAYPFSGTVGDLANDIKNAQGLTLDLRILQMVAKIINPTPGVTPEQQELIARELAEALLERMKTMNEHERVFAIMQAMRARGLFYDPELYDKLMDIVQDDRSPLVRTAVMISLVGPRHDEYLAAIEADTDKDLAELATLTRALIQRTAGQR